MKKCTENVNKIFELIAIEISPVEDKSLPKKKLAEIEEHAETCDACSGVLEGFRKGVSR